MILVVVESPGKIKKIQGYLGSGYTVMASYGHVRDLPSSKEPPTGRYADQPWAKLGVNVDDNFRPIYIVPDSKARTVSALQQAAAKASHVLLATDDDREGESISWHLAEVMNLKDKTKYDRLVFHEITQPAIQAALKNVRTIDYPMVGAQESRRILDRLYGYRVSPLLWDAVGSGTSAGRVQSATLGLLAERELKRLEFVSTPYWRLTAVLGDPRFTAQAFRYNAQPLSTPSSFGPDGKITDGSLLLTREQAGKLVAYLEARTATVARIETAPYKSAPPAPFTTSTLQQAASVKLKLNPKTTMQVAQKLYESGFITYMRTDSPSLSQEATAAARTAAAALFGPALIPAAPRSYGAKSAGAQEAHEAVRPSGTTFKPPADTGLSGEEQALYTLIYQRTVASQMIDLQGQKTAALITAGAVDLKASGTVILEPGYTRMYAQDDAPKDEQALPPLQNNQTLKIHKASAEEKNTPAPSRYTEASAIKRMESAGIGRPSTYASTLATLETRGYTRVVKAQLHVTLLGLLVSAYLSREMPTLVSADFTATMESELDRVSRGELKRTEYLTQVWTDTLEPAIRRSVRTSPDLPLKHSPGTSVDVRAGRVITLALRSGRTSVSLPLDTLPEDLTPASVQAALSSGTFSPPVGQRKNTGGAPAKPGQSRTAQTKTAQTKTAQTKTAQTKTAQNKPRTPVKPKAVKPGSARSSGRGSDR